MAALLFLPRTLATSSPRVSKCCWTVLRTRGEKGKKEHARRTRHRAWARSPLRCAPQCLQRYLTQMLPQMWIEEVKFCPEHQRQLQQLLFLLPLRGKDHTRADAAVESSKMSSSCCFCPLRLMFGRLDV